MLHLISSAGFYGAEQVLLELSRAQLSISGQAPTIGVIDNRYNSHTEVLKRAAQYGLATERFPCARRLDLQVVSLIRRYVCDNGVGIVHCHGYKSNFYGFFAARKDARLVATNHNWITSNWRLRAYFLIDLVLIRFFDRIVAVSDVVRDEMIRYGVPGAKIDVIDNGVDVARLDAQVSRDDARKALDLDPAHIVFATVGSLIPEKGLECLIEAFRPVCACHREARLLIVGDGPLRQQLEEQAVRGGLAEKVMFAGYRSDIPRVLAAVDVFVLASRREGLPMVLLEAMAAGKPVIAARVGGIPKAVRELEDGILVNPGSAVELADAMLSLIREPAKACELGRRALERVKDRFSSELMARKYLELYRGLAGGA